MPQSAQSAPWSTGLRSSAVGLGYWFILALLRQAGGTQGQDCFAHICIFNSQTQLQARGRKFHLIRTGCNSCSQVHCAGRGMNNAFWDHLLPSQAAVGVVKAREPFPPPQAARQGCLPCTCSVLSSMLKRALHWVPCVTLAFKRGAMYFIYLWIL